jgi:hypothetical protein
MSDCILGTPLETVIVAEILEIEVMIGGHTTINNTGNPVFAREEFVVALDGPATVYLARIPNQITGVYINGLLLESTRYELLGASVLMLATSNLIASDLITITYL